MSPERTGIADYSADLLPHLKQHVDLTIVSKASISPEEPSSLPLYQMGNSPFHNWIYDALKARPGIVVLHDWILAQFMGQRDDFAREVLYALGAERGRAVLFGETALTDPLNRRVLDLALGLIVHSEYMATLARREQSKLPVTIAPMPMQVRGKARTLRENVTFGMVGQVTRSKQVERCLRVFGRYHANHPNSRFVIVGESADFDLQPTLATLSSPLREAVIWHGYMPNLDDFHNAIAQIDIVLNLRHPTMGETSAAALRALAQGKPIIVNDVGWYHELPHTIALKIGASSDADLLSAMENCVVNYDEMSAAAIEYIQVEHAPEKTVAQYLRLIQQVSINRD